MLIAGIGSRKIPGDRFMKVKAVARALLEEGVSGRSGGAPGTDEAWLQGWMEGRERNLAAFNSCELWLPEMGHENIPWRLKHQDLMVRFDLTEQHFTIAESFHGLWNDLSSKTKMLHARNVAIILGADCITPVKVCVCWTPDGKQVGGTAMGIKISRAHGIPILNLESKKWRYASQSAIVAEALRLARAAGHGAATGTLL